MMGDLMRRMAEDMGERMGEDMRASMHASRDSLRKQAVDAKPTNKTPHLFDADARHSFDDLADQAQTLGLSSTVDMLTDAMARGKLTEIQAHAQLWPAVASATHADKQYTWPHPWRTRRPKLNDAMARYDENGKYSLARQLEVLVNPRWEALKGKR